MSWGLTEKGDGRSSPSMILEGSKCSTWEDLERFAKRFLDLLKSSTIELTFSIIEPEVLSGVKRASKLLAPTRSMIREDSRAKARKRSSNSRAACAASRQALCARTCDAWSSLIIYQTAENG